MDNQIFVYIAESSLKFLRELSPTPFPFPSARTQIPPFPIPSSLNSPSKLSSTPSTILSFNFGRDVFAFPLPPFTGIDPSYLKC